MTNKKDEWVNLTTIIVAAIALIVLVVLVMIFTGSIGIFEKETKPCKNHSDCNETGYCYKDPSMFGRNYCKEFSERKLFGLNTIKIWNDFINNITVTEVNKSGGTWTFPDKCDQLDEFCPEELCNICPMILPECKTEEIYFRITVNNTIDEFNVTLEEETMGRKKLTPEECLEHGGHYWNYHSANTVVDEFGNPTNLLHLVYYAPGTEPQYRTCNLCGLRQIQNQKWETVG